MSLAGAMRALGPRVSPLPTPSMFWGACNLDLGRIAQGELVARNKLGRVERLMEHFARVRAAGRMSLHEAQVLHGLLRYSCGFFAGRFLYQVCAEVMNLGMASAYGQAAKLADFCDDATGVLSRCVPRKLGVFCERRPVLIFTDGAWENGCASIGAVIIDVATGAKWDR